MEPEDLLKQTFDTCYLTVSDTAIASVPLVYVTPGFENISGYSRDFCIGRNLRFLWPPEEAINTRFNKSELDGLQQFLKWEDGEDTWFGFLLSVDSKGAPFWSLQNVRKVTLGGKVYVVGIATPARYRQDLLSEIAFSGTADAAGQARPEKDSSKSHPLTKV